MENNTTISDSAYYYFIDGELVSLVNTAWDFLNEPEKDIYDNSQDKQGK